MEPRLNMDVLKKKKPKLAVGDIFTYRMMDSRYYFGRVVLNGHEKGPTPGAHLLYFYKFYQNEPVPDLEQMKLSDLLIPPVWTNSQAWLRGYFLNVGKKIFTEGELPLIHCFYSVAHGGKYVDQDRHILNRRYDPCGDWMLVSYRWIDDHISDALEIPRAPEDVS